MEIPARFKIVVLYRFIHPRTFLIFIKINAIFE